MIRHRRRGQITPFAMFAMLILTGAVALVVDAGVFFVTQRQLQTAVDAAALAAVYYVPVCDIVVFGSTDCMASAPALMPPALWPGCATAADCVAYAVLQENLGYTGALCRAPLAAPLTALNHTSTVPSLNTYEIRIECDAPYWFARIFPSIPATAAIGASARAAVGYPIASGLGVSPLPPNPIPPIVSRLLPIP